MDVIEQIKLNLTEAKLSGKLQSLSYGDVKTQNEVGHIVLLGNENEIIIELVETEEHLLELILIAKEENLDMRLVLCNHELGVKLRAELIDVDVANRVKLKLKKVYG